MHYYKRHLGDYAKKAGHLSPLEHGVYNLILDSYYDREQAPTLIEATRWARARTEEEKSAVLAVLDEFFILRDERYFQSRVEEELGHYQDKAETNRTIAVQREQRKRERMGNGSATFVSPEQHEPCTTGQPNHKPLTTNQEPRTKNQEPEINTLVPGIAENVRSASSGKQNCPHQAIIELYHERLPQCPAIRDWTPARETQLRARWNERPERQTLEYWGGLFDYIASCDFLVGRSAKPFFADLEWITKLQNFTKIREGKYENRP